MVVLYLQLVYEIDLAICLALSAYKSTLNKCHKSWGFQNILVIIPQLMMIIISIADIHSGKKTKIFVPFDCFTRIKLIKNKDGKGGESLSPSVRLLYSYLTLGYVELNCLFKMNV
jgi:hypothetical protein